MASKPSKWNVYRELALDLIHDEPNSAPLDIAKRIAMAQQLKLTDHELDTFRMYVSRLRKKEGYAPAEKGGNRSKKGGSKKSKSGKTTYSEDIKKGEANWEYKGEQVITTLKDALKFSQVDLTKWEVDRHVFNSWDVTMKDKYGNSFKRTNYQVKVWFTKKESLVIKKPKFRHIQVEKKDKLEMWIVIGCVHRPFHDKVLWDKFLRFLEDNKSQITGIIINGDYLDLRSLSSHEEWIPEGVDLSMEYSDGLQGIEDIESRLKKSVKKIFIYGNHEDRFFRDTKSIRKYGTSLPSPHEALELEERGWEIITDWKNGYVTLGNNLDVYHGVKVGKNAAKDQLEALPNRNHIFNHTHRFGTYSNQTNTAYNTGCMIDFESDMFKYVDRGVRESWSHGFAVAYIDNNGNNHVYPIKIDNERGFFFKGDVY